MTPKEALAQFEWLADKLAYWSGHDISELDEQFNYSGLLGQVYQALNELDKTKADLDTVRNNYFTFMQDTNADLIRAKKVEELLGFYKQVSEFFNHIYHDTDYIQLSQIYDKIKQLEEELK